MSWSAQSSYGVVIVAWCPSEDNIAHAISLTETGGQVCVVDNSPQPQPWYARVRDAGILLVVNRNRGGLGGGFNRGIDALFGRGVDVVFILDQDSEVDGGYFADMLATPVPVESGRPYLVGPVPYDVETGILLLGHRVAGAEQIAALAKNGTIEVDFLVSSGTMITRRAWQAIGPFDERYVIDYLDWEFCHRAARRGVGLIVNADVLMRHRIGDIRLRTVLGMRMLVFGYAPIRRYYQTRNCVHFTTRHARERRSLLALNAFLVRNILSVLLFEPDKVPKLRAMAAGFADGVVGRLGHLAETRTQLAETSRR
ncbi:MULTISPECIES: hypothetical protein [unclassified Nocardia]|uniref:hypothetical protein n=1 Tax=unclassified Nocardia TaxID=2637762 RepID=UPI001CE40199|nr:MULTISPECIES: hypothetical protein [unclassified Nocardia]